MEVELHLPAGRLPDWLLDPPTRSTQAPLALLTDGADLPWEAKERDGTILPIARHPPIGRRDSFRAGHASSSLIGGEIDGELVFADVLAIRQGTQLGHHLDGAVTQLRPGIGCSIGSITQERFRAQPGVLLLPVDEGGDGCGIVLRGRTHLHMRDQLAGWLLEQVDFIAGPPLGTALVAPAHLRIDDRERAIRSNAAPQTRTGIR